MSIHSPLNLEEDMFVIEVLGEAWSMQKYLKLTINTVKKKKLFYWNKHNSPSKIVFFYLNVVGANWLICNEKGEHKNKKVISLQ